MPRHKFSLVACARWEEACIQEWVGYHQSIGFDHVYLYSNDDDPVALRRAVAPYLHGSDPFVTFRHWPSVGQQAEIYLHFLETFRQDTEWFSFLDVDEFFVLKGVDDIYAFMLDYRNSADCLCFNRVSYGDNDRTKRDDGPVLTSYLRRAHGPADTTKMLCRSITMTPERIREGRQRGSPAFWHYLDGYALPGVRRRDVLHENMDGYASHLPVSARRFVGRAGFAGAVLDRAYIAHFQFKSDEDFVRHQQRDGGDKGEPGQSPDQPPGQHPILAAANAVYDTYLAEYWYRHTQQARRFSTLPPDLSLQHQNVALNKPSWQSSVYEPVAPEAPASQTSGGGNNGLRTGGFGFHTTHEVRPWWIVDLLAPHDIDQIHVYNRSDSAAVAARAAGLDVLGSAEGASWTVVYSNHDEAAGLDGRPLLIHPQSGTPYRFIMLRLRGAGILHADEVEVYGTLSARHIPLIGSALSRDSLG
jgi:Glycosyl transferase family 2/F5/8 type C domain